MIEYYTFKHRGAADEYKDEIQEVCKSKAVRFVRASFLFDDGPIPGIGIDQARNLFQVLNKIGQKASLCFFRRY